MNASADNFRNGFIHPLSYLITSDRPLSPMEQRDYLYRQEMNMEKMCRIQDNSQDALLGIMELKKAELSNILSANQEYSQNNEQLALALRNELWSWLEGLGDELRGISNQIGISYKMNQDGFNNVLKGLWIVNNSIDYGLSQVNKSIHEGVGELLGSLQKLAQVNLWVLSSLEEIDHKLGSPKKTAGLELKRDAFQFYQNGWHEESLKAIEDSIEDLYTDSDCYLLQWIIYLEENRNYPKARESLEKAVKYSRPNNSKVCAAALHKLATTCFIEWDFEKAFDHQLDGVKYGDYMVYWMNLARCAGQLDKQDIFEDAVYRALVGDRLNIIQITTEKFFTDKPWKIQAVKNALESIERGDVKPFIGGVGKIVDERVNTMDEETWYYPIHKAVLAHDIEKLEELLRCGADINKRSRSGNSVIHFLVEDDLCDINMLKLLLKYNIDVNAKNYWWENAAHIFFNTWWHEKSGNRRKNTEHWLEFLKLMIHAWIQLNDRNNIGDTVLHTAISSEDLEEDNDPLYSAIELIINSGADVNMKCFAESTLWKKLFSKCPKTAPTKSPIWIAINKWNGRRLIELLIKCWANLTEID